MADKLTQQITDALTRVATEPNGLPLYASKTEQGLFPNVATAKLAAQKCLADDLVRVVSTDAKGKSSRELYALSEKGWEFLLAAVNPKQVLEDFVRVLEARQGEVGELLDTARRMADSLQGLKEAVARVLPGVTSQRIERRGPTACSWPSPLAGEGGRASRPGEGEADPVFEAIPLTRSNPAGGDPCSLPSPARGEGENNAATLLDAPSAISLAPAILTYLADHTGATDCTLPELFRAVAHNTALTIGEFHDCLRQLYSDGMITLPAWTGPLYTLPEPQFALLIGHGIAYYASLRG